jgi:hypothetical protein
MSVVDNVTFLFSYIFHPSFNLLLGSDKWLASFDTRLATTPGTQTPYTTCSTPLNGAKPRDSPRAIVRTHSKLTNTL